jgi:tetratricopeptide (TPR) repeat protein
VLAPRHCARFIWVGRYEDAISEARRAALLDPRSVSMSTELARALFFAKRYDEALAELERARALDSTYSRIYLTAGEIYAMKGDYPRAILELSRDARAPGRPPRVHSLLGLVLARAGHRTRALQILEDLKARARVGGVGAFDVAIVYVGLGDYDQAFIWLDRSYDDRSLRPFIMDPTFEEVRRDPRMVALFNRIGLKLPR